MRRLCCDGVNMPVKGVKMGVKTLSEPNEK